MTYGIDSTTKLWRSTCPVDRDVGDSAIGCRRHNRKNPYEMSPTERNWDELKSVMIHEGSEEHDIFPDQIPTTRVFMRRGRLQRPWARETTTNSSQDVPRIGNDLQNLHHTLMGNLFTCLSHEEGDIPIESSVDCLKRRVSIIRLRHQADRLGLPWRLSIPWVLESPQTSPRNQPAEPATSIP
jgi:hypothetical protein